MTVSLNGQLYFADLETVHLDPGPGSIWEIALIQRNEEEPGFSSDRELVWHIKPDLHRPASSSAGAVNVGGYYQRCHAQHLAPGEGTLVHNSDWAPGCSLLRTEPDGIGLERKDMAAVTIARTIAPMLARSTLAGANVGSFDAPHLDAFLRAQLEILAADYHYIDIGSVARGWAHGRGLTVPDGPLRLNGALTLVGLDPASYSAHQALDDARAVRDIWDRVTRSAP